MVACESALDLIAILLSCKYIDFTGYSGDFNSVPRLQHTQSKASEAEVARLLTQRIRALTP